MLNPGLLSKISETRQESDVQVDVQVKDNGKNNVWLRLLLFTVILGGITLLLYETRLIRLFLCKKELLQFLQSLGPWGFAGLILLQALQVIVAPIPGEVTGLLGGFLYGPLLGTLLSTIGLTMGSYVAFAFSRTLGRPFVKRFVPEQALNRFDYLLHHRGASLVFILFLIPGIPKDYLCYVLGLGQLSTWQFIVIGGVGRLFGTVLLSFGGNFIRLEQYGRLSILAVVAAIVVIASMVYKERLEGLFNVWHTKSRGNKALECLTVDMR